MSKTFDPNKDYMEEMRKKAATGDEVGFNAAQTARNNKIDAGGLGYARTNYTMSDFAKQNGISSVPAVGVKANPNPGRVWNPNVDHMQESINAAKDGNLAGAMYKEKLHNDKDGDLGLGWGASGVWNYQDKQGLGGLKERKYREIEDHFNNGFNYDYETDPEYQAIRRLKEKEADKAYNDGYAQLSRQFDGDIPVNMINKLLTTKSEIVDQADGYIPTLKQMAYDMYFGKGQQLYNQYGILGDLENQQYQRFLEDRGFMAQGVMDAHNNKINSDERDYIRGIDRRSWIADMASMEFNSDPTITWEEAMKRAEQKYGY